MKRIGVIFGGQSSEHKISLMSATTVISAIERSELNQEFEAVRIGITLNGKWLKFDGDVADIENGTWEKQSKEIDPWELKEIVDFVFPVLHGRGGEDGTVQGMLELIGLPYAGCGVLASSLCMDKAMAKDIFMQNGIPTCKYKLVTADDINNEIDSVVDKLKATFPGEIFVKPVNMGSSIGTSKAKSTQELKEALIYAAKYDRRIMVEESVSGREIEVSVIGNEKVEVSSIGEIVPTSDYYDYDAKYQENSGTELKIPVNLDDETINEIKRLAVAAYKATDCAGFARIDFFVNKSDSQVLINEINTIPGMTKFSMFPLVWRHAGIDFMKLIERIIDYGYERYNDKNKG